MHYPEIHQPKSMRNRFIEREWTHGLYDCYDDCGECTTAWFMTPVYSFLLALRAGEMPTAMMFGGPHVIRTRIRTERKIKGSIAGDCCVTYWCFYCALVQMGNELKYSKPLE